MGSHIGADHDWPPASMALRILDGGIQFEGKPGRREYLKFGSFLR